MFDQFDFPTREAFERKLHGHALAEVRNAPGFSAILSDTIVYNRRIENCCLHLGSNG